MRDRRSEDHRATGLPGYPAASAAPRGSVTGCEGAPSPSVPWPAWAQGRAAAPRTGPGRRAPRSSGSYLSLPATTPFSYNNTTTSSSTLKTPTACRAPFGRGSWYGHSPTRFVCGTASADRLLVRAGPLAGRTSSGVGFPAAGGRFAQPWGSGSSASAAFANLGAILLSCAICMTARSFTDLPAFSNRPAAEGVLPRATAQQLAADVPNSSPSNGFVNYASCACIAS